MQNQQVSNHSPLYFTPINLLDTTSLHFEKKAIFEIWKQQRNQTISVEK